VAGAAGRADAGAEPVRCDRARRRPPGLSQSLHHGTLIRRHTLCHHAATSSGARGCDDLPFARARSSTRSAAMTCRSRECTARPPLPYSRSLALSLSVSVSPARSLVPRTSVVSAAPQPDGVCPAAAEGGQGGLRAAHSSPRAPLHIPPATPLTKQTTGARS
jgi:hypothetical protein